MGNREVQSRGTSSVTPCAFSESACWSVVWSRSSAAAAILPQGRLLGIFHPRHGSIDSFFLWLAATAYHAFLRRLTTWLLAPNASSS